VQSIGFVFLLFIPGYFLTIFWGRLRKFSRTPLFSLYICLRTVFEVMQLLGLKDQLDSGIKATTAGKSQKCLSNRTLATTFG